MMNMKRFKKVFGILLFVVCTLTACWGKDDPWHPYYYEEYEVEADLIVAYKGEPSGEYLIIPDSGYRFIIKVEGEEKTFCVQESFFQLHKNDKKITLFVEKKFDKENGQQVDEKYSLFIK